MTEHVLKTLAPYWDAIADGRKNFEVRRDDRGFQTGDVLVLHRLVSDLSLRDKQVIDVTDSGKIKELRRRVTYVLTGGQFGIEPGYVVMGLGDPEEKKP